MTNAWLLPSAALAINVSVGCRPATEEVVGSEAKACVMAKTTVVAQGRFTADQIAGCDGGQSDDLSGYYLLRLNGYCREDVCGSVLLGWYVVDQETGDVFEWDMGALSRGQEVTNPN